MAQEIRKDDGLMALHRVLRVWVAAQPEACAETCLDWMTKPGSMTLGMPAGDAGLAGRIMRTILRDALLRGGLFDEKGYYTPLCNVIQKAAETDKLSADRRGVSRPGPAQQVLMAVAAVATALAEGNALPEFADNPTDATT